MTFDEWWDHERQFHQILADPLKKTTRMAWDAATLAEREKVADLLLYFADHTASAPADGYLRLASTAVRLGKDDLRDPEVHKAAIRGSDALQG